MHSTLALAALLAAAVAASPLDSFEVVCGFADLDVKAEPGGFGLLLVESGGEGDLELAEELLEAVSMLPEPGATALYRLPPGASGRSEVVELCTEHGTPGVTVLVGHCGFLELDSEMLATEVLDAWSTWGDPGSRRTGICNFCRRCNP